MKRLVGNPGRFLAVTQIGLTFIGFLASAYAAVNLTDQPAGPLRGHRLPILSTVGRGVSLIIVTLLLSAVHDRLRRARAQEPGPGPRRALRAAV